jgi:hypothetical protein
VDPNFQARFNSATRFAQSFASETITISSVGYPCTESQNITIDMDYEQGGAKNVLRGSVIISKLDLPTAPVRGVSANFRGSGFRVTEVDDLVVNWQVNFVQFSN